MRTLLIALVLSAPAWATQSYVQTVAGNTADSGGSNPATYPGVATTSGHALYCMAQGGASDTVTSVTSVAGNTFAASTRYASSGNMMQWWYSVNITGNSNEIVTANFSTVGSYRSIDCTEVIIPSTAVADVDKGGTTSSGTSCTTNTFSTAQASEVVVMGGAPAATGQTFTAGTGYTLDTVWRYYFATEYQVFSSIQSGVTATLNYSSTVASVCGAFSMKDTAGSIPVVRHRVIPQ